MHYELWGSTGNLSEIRSACWTEGRHKIMMALLGAHFTDSMVLFHSWTSCCSRLCDLPGWEAGQKYAVDSDTFTEIFRIIHCIACLVVPIQLLVLYLTFVLVIFPITLLLVSIAFILAIAAQCREWQVDAVVHPFVEHVRRIYQCQSRRR